MKKSIPKNKEELVLHFEISDTNSELVTRLEKIIQNELSKKITHKRPTDKKNPNV